MLLHCSGARYEDMYWIDLDTLQIIAKEISRTAEKKIVYSNATLRTIPKYPHLLTIHSHPDSFPPSIDDFNSNFDHGYIIGIVVCHNGKIYMYSSNERINENYYKMVVEDYLKNGYTEDEAQIQALSELQNNFDISFKEVTDQYDRI